MPSDPEELAAWLLHEAPEKLVVYPTSDDLAWVLAREREALSRRHFLYSPPLETLEALLDKKRLHELAHQVGLRTPTTWYPRDEAEALRLAPQLKYPVLLKPRTQVLSRTRFKGLRVAGPEAMQAAWRQACAALRFAPSLLARLPEAAVPMVQAYHPGRANHVADLSGFVDRSQRHFVARASTKILQVPRGLGVGTGFESCSIDPAVVSGVRALCAAAGYYGIFDIEFLAGEEPLLIDFNPRIYNQMAFEIALGVESPMLAYLGATEAHAQLASGVEEAHRAAPVEPAIFCNKFKVRHLFFWQVLVGKVRLAEAMRWRKWHGRHQDRAVDPFDAPGDRLPLAAYCCAEVMGALRHPRSFFRQQVLT